MWGDVDPGGCAWFCNSLFIVLALNCLASNCLCRCAQEFPFATLIMIPSTFMVMANVLVGYAGYVLMAAAAIYSGETVWSQANMWWAGYGIYFNELMVKRLALVGCTAMVLGRHLLELNAKHTAGFAGLLLEESKDTMEKKRPFVLLIARLLISLLFLFVGITEINRQLSPPIHHGKLHMLFLRDIINMWMWFFCYSCVACISLLLLVVTGHAHHRPPGDGHDEIWAKMMQFALSIPLSVGLFTKGVSRVLSFVCLLEALICWQFWSQSAHNLGIGYAIHAREHFIVNVAVSGGLLLLQVSVRS